MGRYSQRKSRSKSREKTPEPVDIISTTSPHRNSRKRCAVDGKQSEQNGDSIQLPGDRISRPTKTKQQRIVKSKVVVPKTGNSTVQNVDNVEAENNNAILAMVVKKRNRQTRSRSKSSNPNICGPTSNDANLDDLLRDDIAVQVHANEDDFIDSDDEQCLETEEIDKTIGQQNFESDGNISDSSSEVVINKHGRFATDGNSLVDSVGDLDVNNPALMKLVNQPVDKKLKQRQSTEGNALNTPEKGILNSFRREDQDKIHLSLNQNRDREKQVAKLPLIKSPSDTTIYRPGLQRDSSGNGQNGSPNLSNLIARQGQLSSPVTQVDYNQSNQMIIDKISNFVDSIRIESESSRNRSRGVRDEVNTTDVAGPSSAPIDPDHADHIADRAVIDAECFKATVAPPKGNYQDDNDDDFFHVTCHVDPGMIQKIEKGEFVDLEKLIPKERFGYAAYRHSDENRMELVNRQGMTYFVPVSDREKITGIKRWDQAFRVYAAIYSKVHPDRVVEIWQYIHVIHTAAASYVWDNVAYCDYTFCQLMARKPYRSWAKTYNQVWNLAMRDPLSRTISGNGNGSNGSNKSWKDNCCWEYNRNKKCKKL